MPTIIRVLILEDRPEDAELMMHELERAHLEIEWRRVDTESEFNAHLGWHPDVILSDYNMPLLDARRALELLDELELDIPFIVVSGAIGEDIAVAMMRRGAADYLLKDRLGRLGAAVRRALEERRLRDETRRAEQALRASELRFYSFMNNNPALAFIKDHAGRILYINNTCEQMFGRPPAECLGKMNHDLFPPDVAGRLRANDLAVVDTGEASRMVEEVLVPNGPARQMLTFRFPFTEADGQRLLGGVSIDISELVQTQRALSAALASKGVLLREVHHRVKNNLQIISSLLTMQADSTQDPALAQALQDTQERVQSMALVHERLNQDDQPDQLDFSEYAQALARDLFHSHAVDCALIELRFDLAPVWLTLSQAIPCGLILNELLTNGLKYAFPDGRAGEIAVTLRSATDQLVELTVADNGVGIPANVDWKTSHSRGLRIIHILTNQLDGTIHHDGCQGTAFSVTFPRLASQHMPSAARRPNRVTINKLEQTA